MKSLWKWGRLGLGLVLTFVFLWLTLRHIPMSGVFASLEHARFWWVLLALFALVIDYGVRAHRWWWLLRRCGSPVELRVCVWPLIASFAVNNVVPFRAGDAFRVMGFREELRASGSWVLATLLIERLLDLTVLLVFLSLGLWGLSDATRTSLYVRTAVFASGISIAAWLILVFYGQHVQNLVTRICQHKVVAKYDFASPLIEFSRELFFALSIVRTPARFFVAIAMSAAVWIAEGAVFGAGAEAVLYDGRPWGPWFALATGSLSTLVPSSPGFVGTFDFFTVSGLSAYGASAPVATAAAFLIHGVLWFPLTAAGLIYLLRTNFTARWAQGVTRAAKPQERV